MEEKGADVEDWGGFDNNDNNNIYIYKNQKRREEEKEGWCRMFRLVGHL